MGVLGESWCFCSGGGRSEKIKGGIYCSKSAAMARVCQGTGFLIHKNLLLTTHLNLPSVSAAEGTQIRLNDRFPARLVPHRFFITSSVLDLTIVGVDTLDTDPTSHQHPQFLRTRSSPTLDLGSVAYLLGHTGKEELTVGEGKVVIATDNLIKLSTDGVTWCSGSAGFDVHGNLAFMVCDPMKLASSPTAKSSSTSSSSSSSWKKDFPMQFGIPIPIICDWLNQHWEGSLDELNKPKLPLIRLMSAGQKSEHSCASFTLRQVFKSGEREKDATPSSSHIISIPRNHNQDENPLVDLLSSTHDQGIPTPEIYESPRLTSGPIRKTENTQVQLLDINFPPRAPRSIVLPLPIKRLASDSDSNDVKEPTLRNKLREDLPLRLDTEIAPAESGNHSEAQASSSPIEVLDLQNEGDGFHYSSEGETMYSAETMESRNYTSPRDGKFQQVGRSQSCVSYSRYGAAKMNSAACKGTLEKQRSLIQVRKMYSQAASSHRNHDYFSPTVSSIMKKQNNSKQLTRPRQSVVQLSPRWNF